MFNHYEEALQWIHSRLKLGVKPGLKRMHVIMEKLDSPEKQLKTIHIGGTNGKGSTLTYLRSILQASGLKVGTFTSPYIEQFNERISVNNQHISDEELLQLANLFYPLVIEMDETELGGPTEFELITAMSFYYFAKINKVDIVLYEVGLGGRFDSTNIISPLLSIITSIGLDHTSILGNTYKEIAFEKAGIIKRNTPIITAVQQAEALAEIKEKAVVENAPLFVLGQDFSISNQQSTATGELFTFQSAEHYYEDVEIKMMGAHQTENSALALKACELLQKEIYPDIDESHIRTGLQRAFWPGRFEIVSHTPLVILDGAHNNEGVQTLVAELTKRYRDKKKHIIFTALSDKATDTMIEQLDQIADSITFVTFDYPRASKTIDLFNKSTHKNKYHTDSWVDAIQHRFETLEDNEMIVITGSLYFLSLVKEYWKNKSRL